MTRLVAVVFLGAVLFAGLSVVLPDAADSSYSRAKCGIVCIIRR